MCEKTVWNIAPPPPTSMVQEFNFKFIRWTITMQGGGFLPHPSLTTHILRGGGIMSYILKKGMVGVGEGLFPHENNDNSNT